MEQKAVLLGLDLGASKVVAVVAVLEEDGSLSVTGAGMASPQGGIRQGEINDMELTTRAIRRAVEAYDVECIDTLIGDITGVAAFT